MVQFLWGRYSAWRMARMIAEVRVAALLQAKRNPQEGHGAKLSNTELAALTKNKSTRQAAHAVVATLRLQTTEEAAFAMAAEGRGVPAAVAVVERVTEEEEAAKRETQQQQWMGAKLAAVRICTPPAPHLHPTCTPPRVELEQAVHTRLALA